MYIHYADGLFRGISDLLDEKEISLLGSAFAKLKVEKFGQKVSNPGRLVFHSFCKENFGSDDYVGHFQEHLVKLLRAALKDEEIKDFCCKHHRNLFEGLKPSIQKNDQTWLITFFEVLTAYTEDIHFQFLSQIGNENSDSVLFSRFMPLDLFIENHTNMNNSKYTLTNFCNCLSPNLGAKARNISRDLGELGNWGGRVGTYPSLTKKIADGIEQYVKNCESVKPFATLKSYIDDNFDRLEPPDRLLNNLGITFETEKYWIELVYSSEHVRFKSADRTMHIAIPTRIESAGNWAFWPDRDDDKSSNHALDLSTGSRGCPEIVHERFDINVLKDAIVWPVKTKNAWGGEGSPFLS